LPADLQQELVRMIPGLEEANIIRPGYAIEYDFIDPRELTPQLETVRIKGLFHAGQINGTTGYEEAGCQGLIAGINAALLGQGRESLLLRREESYIGVLIDDLIKQGVDEPYRIFTSRAEFRLALRHDNADSRLSSYGRSVGLLGDSDWDRFNQRRDRLARLRNTLETTRLKRSDAAYSYLARTTGLNLGDSISLSQLVSRPNVLPETILQLLPSQIRTEVTIRDLESVSADFLYSGYINAQRATLDRLHTHDNLCVPKNFNFRAISGLSHEMTERLERAHPQTFGQARRIPGLTPAALSTLLVQLTLGQPAS
jgi:tRNA uridine 5-carboxymethylaminomethyl modification enzyme